MVKEEGFTTLFEGHEIVADIVLVHGLGGSPQRTWTYRRQRRFSLTKREKNWPLINSNSRDSEQVTSATATEERDIFWPRDLLPKVITNARIMTFGYDSKFLKFGRAVNQNGVFEHAQNMLHGIERQRRSCPHRPLILVAHSLGGIITKEMLRQSEAAKHQPHLLSVFKSTFGVIFFGCPHRGANLAEWGSTLGQISKLAFGSTNTRLIRSLQKNAEILNVVNSAFETYLKDEKLRVHSFLEEKGMLGQNGITGKVVEPLSSIIGDATEGREGINANHRTMVTFECLEDEGFIKVSNVIQRYLSEILNGPSKPNGMKELSAEQSECLQTLSFPEANNRFNSIPNPHKNTCRWMTEQNAVGFTEWRDNGRGLFCINGKPGCGKSILLKYLLLEARKQTKSSQSIAGFFFNGRGFPLERSLEGMMRSLLVQLLPQYPASCLFVVEMYKQKLLNKEGGGQFKGPIRWSRSDLQQAMMSVIRTISSTQRVLLFLDAIDECNDPAMDVVEFLQELLSEIGEQEANVKICVTTRPLGGVVTRLMTGPVLQLEQYIMEDISSYIESRIAYLEAVEGFTAVAEHIKADIIAKANNVFLWVTLVTEKLRNGSAAGDSLSELRKMLSSTPSGLSDLYHHTLEKIQEKYQNETRLMFHIVLAAKRPLSLTEFWHILAFEPTKSLSSQHEVYTTSSVVQDDNLMETRLLSRCGGLLEVVSNGPKGSRTIQFIHQSVKDYLVQKNNTVSILNTLKEHIETNAEINGNLILFRSCVQYLSISELGTMRTNLEVGNRWTLAKELEDAFREFPLLEYAAKYWTSHWAIVDCNQTTKSESLDPLLDNLNTHSWIQIYNLCSDSYATYAHDTSLLTIAIESNVCGYVSDNRQHVRHEGTNLRFGYPLMTACALGYGSMAELLISCGADINMQGGLLDTALLAVAINGHDHMIKSMIAWGADINARGPRYGTALHAASRNGEGLVVRLLLDHGADVNIMHDMEGSALHIAAARGFEYIVKMLLKSGADLDLLDGDGWAPIACAWFYRRYSVLKLLSTPKMNVSSFDGPVGMPPVKLRLIGSTAAASLTLSDDGLHISSDQLVHPAAACSDHCMPIGRYLYYFEFKIIRSGINNAIGIGFSTLGPDIFLSMPGWTWGSCGYHGDDGAKLFGNGKPLSYGPTYGKATLLAVE